MVPSESKARSFWEVQSPVPNNPTILIFLSWFLSVLPRWKKSEFFSTEFTTTWLTSVLRSFYKRKYILNLNIWLRNSKILENLTLSCPGSPVKGQNYWGSGRNPEHWHVATCTFFYISIRFTWQNTITAKDVYRIRPCYC